MAVESGNYIADMDQTKPDGATEDANLVDDYLRFIKKCVKQSFPNVNGVVNATPGELNILAGATVTTTELNYLSGVTSNVQTQLDSKASDAAKADKVSGATAGNLAALDGSGNLTDSTYSPSSFQPADPDIPTQAATTAEMQAGTETALRSMSPKNVAEAIAAQAPSTWDFESAEIAFPAAAGTVASAPHGLGVVPTSWQVVIRCKVSDRGYNVGDEVDFTRTVPASGHYVASWVNATEIGIARGSSNIYLTAKDGSSTANLTPSSWVVVFRAKK